MAHTPRYAILLDGAFVIRRMEAESRRFPTADEIEALCAGWQQRPELIGLSLLRIYFYHAPPSKDVLVHPIDKTRVNLGNMPTRQRNESLLHVLEEKADIAVRLGETVVHDWKIGEAAMKALKRVGRPVEARDFVPNITQKGVDVRIGLDIARLALREMVQAIVVVTGDSDFIPAFKFARREGVRVFLDTLGHGVRRDLKAHADRVF